MLIYSMSVSVDGFIADRQGAFEWTIPGEEQFRDDAAVGKGALAACGALETVTFGSRVVYERYRSRASSSGSGGGQ